MIRVRVMVRVRIRDWDETRVGERVTLWLWI